MNILAVTACSKYYDVVKEANFCNAVLNNLTIALCFWQNIGYGQFWTFFYYVCLSVSFSAVFFQTFIWYVCI